MGFQKIQQEIFNPINENVKKLAQLFPSVVKDGQVDFEALKSELGEFQTVSDKLSEQYGLGWAGKEEAKNIAKIDIVGRTLKIIPNESKNIDTTQNLYIEGDNLEVLKLLRNSYYNKIKMIYIDPPYNTGNDFVYKDKFSVSEIENDIMEENVSESGERLVINQKSNGKYHANWLNMMFPRLKIAKELLTDDGVIFISIDDNELANLKLICDEIFGEENLIDNIIWKKRYGGGAKEKYLVTLHESILFYAKNKDSVDPIFVPLDDESIKRYYTKKDEKYETRGGYRIHPLEAGKAMDTRENLIYPIPAPDGTEIFPKKQWLWSKERAYEALKNNELEITMGKEGWVVSTKQYLKDEDGNVRGAKFFSIIDDIYTQHGTNEMIEIFKDAKVFPYPKPSLLIKELLKIGSSKNGIILDFFSGSATTAHAIMQLNDDDGGCRKFIMVQLPEPCDEKSEAYKAGFKNICEIGKERIRRAGEKIKEENKDKEGIENLDIGFKVFRVADTNIRWFSEAIKSDNMALEESMMSDKDRLDFNPGFTDIDVVYEILLRHRDIPLSANVEKLAFIGERTYIFAYTVVVCLEQNVTESMIDKIAAIEPMPMKIIFRDSAFGDDITLKTNSMLRLEAQMKKNSGSQKKAYRVEFI